MANSQKINNTIEKQNADVLMTGNTRGKYKMPNKNNLMLQTQRLGFTD